ncbi:MAG: hypothetical protein ACK5M4_04540 [Pseudorhodobacter sp.]
MKGDMHHARSHSLLVAALAMSCILATPVMAADDEGGLRFRFGIAQEFSSRSNPGMRIPSADSERIARTRFSMGVISETRIQRFELSMGGALEAGQGREHGIAQPNVDLSYRRESASSVLTLGAFIRETDVDALDFSAGEDIAGNPILSVSDGTGTQRRKGVNMGLEFGRDSRFGGMFSMGMTDTDYFDTTDPDLVDNRRRYARLSLRYDLTKVTQLRASGYLSRLKEDGDPTTNKTESLSFGIVNQRVDGDFSVDAGFGNTDAGWRQSLMVGRSYDLPTGWISARLGVSSRAAGGGNDLVGNLDWLHEMPQGDIKVSLDREVTGDERDEENLITRLSMIHSRELTRRSVGRIGLVMQDREETATGLSTKTADLSMGLRYDLTPDWGLDFGATHRIHDRDGAGRAHSNDLFLSLSRNFEFLY